MCSKKATVKKPAKAKAAKPTKVQVLEEKAKLFDRIRAKEKERRKLLLRFGELTTERKAAREALGFCEIEICGLGYSLDEKHPLFDQADKQQELPKAASDQGEKAGAPAATEGNSKAPEPAEASNAWRHWPVAKLIDQGLPAGKVKILEEAGLSTMGKLMDAMNQIGQEDFWWKSIRGLGEGGYYALTLAITALRKYEPSFQADVA
jgi:hypothetical protein